MIVALGTGLRPNENFGLKQANIDVGARIIRVRQTFSRFGEGGLKNFGSWRDVDSVRAPCTERSASNLPPDSCGVLGYGQLVGFVHSPITRSDSVRKLGR